MLLPIILSGGSGTRLWPLSRETYPKQFLAINGGKSMLQQTALRLRGMPIVVDEVASPLLVCNEQHRFLAAAQLSEVGIKSPTILLEPFGRNTAPALTLAALFAMKDGCDPIMLAMPADHLIKDIHAFHAAIRTAYEAASLGQVVTFGVVPTYLETGYGYIQYDKSNKQKVGVVKGFTEKPSKAVAQKYINSGEYLWNSGIFMFRASTWIHAIEIARPDILQSCRSSMLGARCDLDFVRPDADVFNNCPSESIDYAVMEKLPDHPEWDIGVGVVPLESGWSDVGSWDSFWNVSNKDVQGNALIGDSVLQKDCYDSLLMSNGRVVVGVGLRNLIVVETTDAILVVDKSCTQDVKHVVGFLAHSGGSTAQQHRKVHRPWGWYDRLDSGERFQVKRIVVDPGASLSLQMHKHRAEHWVVVKGVAEVTRGDKCFRLKENESTYIPSGDMHRLHNPGQESLEIIEIQSGDYLGEDDIVRYDDIYGRLESYVISKN